MPKIVVSYIQTINIDLCCYHHFVHVVVKFVRKEKERTCSCYVSFSYFCKQTARLHDLSHIRTRTHTEKFIVFIFFFVCEWIYLFKFAKNVLYVDFLIAVFYSIKIEMQKLNLYCDSRCGQYMSAFVVVVKNSNMKMGKNKKTKFIELYLDFRYLKAKWINKHKQLCKKCNFQQ